MGFLQHRIILILYDNLITFRITCIMLIVGRLKNYWSLSNLNLISQGDYYFLIFVQQSHFKE